MAPHLRHLVDPEGVDPAVAATYACSGITVYSAISKAMPMDRRTRRSWWSAPAASG